MRHYLIRQLLCDACLRGRMEEIRQSVFKEVGIIIEYRVPIDFRMQLKPRLNFISANVVFFFKEWSDVGTRHYLLLNVGAAVLVTLKTAIDDGAAFDFLVCFEDPEFTAHRPSVDEVVAAGHENKS
jgi:hypothetical protein